MVNPLFTKRNNIEEVTDSSTVKQVEIDNVRSTTKTIIISIMRKLY